MDFPIVLTSNFFPAQAFFNAMSDRSLIPTLQAFSRGEGAGFNDAVCEFPNEIDVGELPFKGVKFIIFEEELILPASEFVSIIEEISSLHLVRHPENGLQLRQLIDEIAKNLRINWAKMVKTDFEEKLLGILKLYSDGFCTSGEVVYAVVLHFGREKEIDFDLWNSLPEWVKKDVINQLADFNAEMEFYLPAHSESLEVVKGNFLSMKSWLSARGQFS